MRQIVESIIKEYVEKYPQNKEVQTVWKEPLIAYASAEDVLFPQLKTLISPTHALPGDFLPEAKTVIAYFLPFEESIVTSNIDGREASKIWGIAYIDTNQLIFDLNTRLEAELVKLGYQATIIPATHNFYKDKLISDWSHRHVAYIAGLGKFGLNNMLITEKGCCGRIGTVVTSLEIEPTGRSEAEYCLYKSKGICQKCSDRCVNGSLTLEGFDRHKCYEMCLENNDRLAIGQASVCGKCLVGMPCSFKRP